MKDYTCNCFHELEEQLSASDMILDDKEIGTENHQFVSIRTLRIPIIDKSGKRRMQIVTPSFCPFCGAPMIDKK